MSDFERLQRTDEFVRLFTKEGRWVFSYILMLVPNKADAEEVFQETNVTLWQKFHEFAPGSSFRAWATQVAYYKVLQYRATRKNRPMLLDDGVLEAIHGAAATLVDRLDDFHGALEDCRKELSDPARELLDRRYEPGATTQTVANQIGRSVRSTYRALERIHDTLYNCIRRKMAAEERP